MEMSRKNGEKLIVSPGLRAQQISHPELLISMELVFRDMHSWDKNNSNIAGLTGTFGY
jgi:hypothetical protein